MNPLIMCRVLVLVAEGQHQQTLLEKNIIQTETAKPCVTRGVQHAQVMSFPMMGAIGVKRIHHLEQQAMSHLIDIFQKHLHAT